MGRLLTIEWLKLKSYKAFWILFGLFLVGIFGVCQNAYRLKAQAAVAVSNEQQAMAGNVVNTIVGTPFSFPDVWHTVSYLSSFLLFIPGLLIIMLITNEYTFRTHRQNIIDGLSRSQFVYSKMLLCVLFSAASTAVVFIAALLYGSLTGSAFGLSKLEYIGYFFIQALSYIGLAMVFGVLLKRSGLAIGVYFLYIFVIENSLAFLLNRYFGTGVGDFLTLEVTDSLIPFPFFRAISLKQMQHPNSAYLLLGAVAYLLVYYIICKRYFEKANL